MYIPIFYNLLTVFRKLYKIVKLEEYLRDKIPLSLTKPDTWLKSYIGKPLKHITYASSQLLTLLLSIKGIYFKSWMPANF